MINFGLRNHGYGYFSLWVIKWVDLFSIKRLYDDIDKLCGKRFNSP